MRIKIVALSDLNVTIPEFHEATLVPRFISLPPSRNYPAAFPGCDGHVSAKFFADSRKMIEGRGRKVKFVSTKLTY